MRAEQEKLCLEAAECRLLAQARSRQHRDGETSRADLGSRVRALETECGELRRMRDDLTRAGEAAEEQKERAMAALQVRSSSS